MIAPRLQDAPADVQDTFAVARAALEGYGATGEMTEEFVLAMVAAIDLRKELGWDSHS